MRSKNCRYASFSGFVLAAGLGSRLRPITDSIPKPLIPLCGVPLLESVLTKIKNAGATEIGLNGHYKLEKIANYIKKSRFAPMTTLFHEPKILGTGGALSNAKTFLSKSELCLIHNGDVLCDVSIENLIRDHLESGNILTLVLTNGPENRVLVDGRRILDICGKLGIESSSKTATSLTYTGIALMSKAFIEFVPDKVEPYNLVDIYAAAITSQPEKVGAFIPDDLYWNDLGTVAQFVQAHEDVLSKRLFVPPGISVPPKTIHVGQGSKVSSSAVLEGFVSIGKNCVIGERAYLKNTIVLDNVTLGTDGYYSGLVVGSGFYAHRNMEFLKSLKILERIDLNRSKVASLVEQGSDRYFYRIDIGGRSKALMVSPKGEPDFQRFVEIGRYLAAHRLAPPRIHSIDTSNYSLLMEDLGDALLHRLLSAATSLCEVERLYKKVISYLARFQSIGTKHIKECPAAGGRALDYEVLRWETTYFKNNFLQRVMGLEEKDTAPLDDEFHLLATLAAKQPYVLTHRDFQSQNILIKNGRVRIVDFQGARLGPLCYDATSLLNDSYFEVPEDMKQRLVDYYYSQISLMGLTHPHRDVFDYYMILAGLQRNAQALGAFGFLALTKGKKQYLNYIPLGLKHLRAGLQKALDCQKLSGAFPLLTKIVFASRYPR